MASKYEKMFVPGALTVPEKLLKKQAFCAGARLVLPTSYIVEGALTQVENQGSKPWCAAYSATTFAEAVLWRKDGYPQQIDPSKIYAYAKSVDGNPTGDGTSLNAAVEGLLNYGYFNAQVCKIRTFGGKIYGVDAKVAQDNLKAAIFRFGACVVGFDIDESWYAPKLGVVKGGGARQGGHAVCAVGYDAGGFIIRNSWGGSWGHSGDAYICNAIFDRQFMYGCCLSNALNDFA